MPQEIESVKPALTVVLDDGDFIINSTGPIGKAMAQAVLPLLNSAKRVTIITDGEMKVMKRQAGADNQAQLSPEMAAMQAARNQSTPAQSVKLAELSAPDVQDQFVDDLAAGRTGEVATGEVPAPTPGPSDPVAIPAPKKRKPQIFQDAAAPPAPELAEAEMAAILAEAQQAEQDAAKVAEDQRFQRQQAVQAGADPAEAAAEEPAAAKPRARRERQLATTGRPCGRCGGGGQIQGEAGFVGACPVCHGEGQVKTWDRSLKVR